jgi:hypothetical protein
MERLSVWKRAVQNCHTERFDLKIWALVQVKEPCAKRVKILNRSASLDITCALSGCINTAWERVIVNYKCRLKIEYVITIRGRIKYGFKKNV